MKLAQNLAQMKEKLCKVIPNYAENVNKNTITEILQNCCKCRKYSKIKRFKHFIKSLPVYCRVGISPLGGLVDSFSTTLFYHKP